MTAEPVDPRRASDPTAGTDPFEVIHLGGQAAVIVPLAEFLRLRALERDASPEALQDAETEAAAQDWLARLSRLSWNLGGGPPPETRRVVGLG